MNGHCIPDTPIAVDFWDLKKCYGGKVHFLTHFHGDHIKGLTPSWSKVIYCSDLTKKLLHAKFQFPDYQVKCLTTNERHLVSLDGSDDCGSETMTVTVVDASHCPGAVMFVFQGYFGTIFYTGDFRYESTMTSSELINSLPPIDTLYLDNTYLQPGCTFPTRTEAKQQIISIIERHPHHRIMIADRRLGKEDLYHQLALHFSTWIVVSPARHAILKTIGAYNVFTQESEGRIHLVPFYQVNKKNIRRWDDEHPTIVIIPSALYTGLDGSPYVNQPHVFVVPYSDHSSYQELRQFVSELKPKRVIPIVSANARGVLGTDISGRANMGCLNVFLDSSPRKQFIIPLSVRTYMDTVNTRHVFLKRKGSRVAMLRPRKRPPAKGVVFEENETKIQTEVLHSISQREIGEQICAECDQDCGSKNTNKEKMNSTVQELEKVLDRLGEKSPDQTADRPVDPSVNDPTESPVCDASGSLDKVSECDSVEIIDIRPEPKSCGLKQSVLDHFLISTPRTEERPTRFSNSRNVRSQKEKKQTNCSHVPEFTPKPGYSLEFVAPTEVGDSNMEDKDVLLEKFHSEDVAPHPDSIEDNVECTLPKNDASRKQAPELVRLINSIAGYHFPSNSSFTVKSRKQHSYSYTRGNNATVK